MADESPQSNWEVIDHTMHFRPEAIEMRQYREGIHPEETETGQTTAHPLEQDSETNALTQTMEDSSQQHSLDQDHNITRPTRLIQRDINSSTTEPKHVPIKARLNDLTAAGKSTLEQQQGIFGFAQSAEWVSPKAKYIYRCSICLSTLNSNGLERSVRNHLKKAHRNIIDPVIVTVTRQTGKTMQFSAPAPGLGPKIGGPPKKDRPQGRTGA